MEKANANIEVHLPMRPSNPKRLARKVAKEAKKPGISTFAQEAIKKDIESHKSEHQTKKKQIYQDLADYKRTRKTQKRKEKKRGH